MDPVAVNREAKGKGRAEADPESLRGSTGGTEVSVLAMPQDRKGDPTSPPYLEQGPPRSYA